MSHVQIIPEVERQARIDFYTDNNIGWVARPKHGVDGFVRAGKFKKASNMNYALNISNRTEDLLRDMILQQMEEDGIDEISEGQEDALYKAALERVLEQDGKAWADGDIRVGEFILIIDSDTRVVSHSILLFYCLRLLSFVIQISQLIFPACRLPNVRRRRNVPFSRSCYRAAQRRCHASRRRLFREWHHFLHQPNLHGDSLRSRLWRGCSFRWT